MYMDYPIFKKAIDLNIYIEDIVKNFSKYNKYNIGSELRDKARDIVYSIYKIYYMQDKRKGVIYTRNLIEEMKIIVFLAKELKALRSFKQFEILSNITFELAKQAQGWLRSLK